MLYTVLFYLYNILEMKKKTVEMESRFMVVRGQEGCW